MRSPYLDNDVVRTTFRAPEAVTKNNDLRIRLIGDGSMALREIRTDMGFAGRGDRFPGAFLRLTKLLPLRRIMPTTMGCPSGWLESIILRPRSTWSAFFWAGTSTTISESGTGTALASYLREMLLDSRTLSRPYWQKNNLEAMLRHHIKGNRNYTNEIHRVLSLELASPAVFLTRITMGTD